MNENVIPGVKKRIAEVLAMSPGEIGNTDKIVDDLGAESLDLVELMFLLEQEFSIKLDKKDLSLSAQLGLSEREIHQNNVLTPQALELLRQRYPDAEQLLVEGITRDHLAALLTVEEVAKAVARKMSEGDA